MSQEGYTANGSVTSLEAAPEPHPVAAWHSICCDSLGPYLSGEASCDFGVGVLVVEFPVGDASYSYEIGTVNDQRVESDETFTLNMVALSRNVELGSTSQAVLTITNNDSAGVTLGAERVGTNEEASGSYTVKLTSQPHAWVRVYAESANGCKVAGGYVELGPNNWNRDQNVLRPYARHDYDAADEEVTISHRIEASSRDAAYGSVKVKPVTVSVTDQHSPGVIVETTSLSPMVGATAGYRVYLNADPSPVYGDDPDGCYDYTESRTVTITATSSDTDVATVSPASVTFRADDYDPKSFSVTAVSPGDATITHTVSGSDPDYTDGTIMAKKVTVSVPAPQQAEPEPTMMDQRAITLRAETPPPGPVLELELAMLGRSIGGRATLGADRAYDTRDFVWHLRALEETPLLAQNERGRHSAIDGRTTRCFGDSYSQRRRELVEEVFGWIKTAGARGRLSHLGRTLNRLWFELTAAV